MIRAVLLSLVVAVAVRAQTDAPAAHIWVDAPGTAAVLVDDTLAGPPGTWIEVTAAAHRVAAVSDPEAWDARRVDVDIMPAAGDSLRLRLDLPRRLRVETLPIRAHIVFEDASGAREILGTSPVTVDLPAGAAGTLVATLEGYEPERLPLADASASGPTQILLRPSPGAEPELELLPTERSTRSRTLVDLGVGAATVAAAAIAVHYKFRADAIDDDYRGEDPALRGNEALRQEALRLDRYSAVALGAMQVGVATLAIRFILR